MTAPDRPGRVLVIAGSDSSGGAGIQADIKTITALGGYAASAITAVTVQDTLGVHAVHPVPPQIIASQIRAVLADPGVGSLCVPMVAGSLRYAMDKVEALLPAILEAGKPAVIAVLGDEFPVPGEFIAAFRDKGIPVLRSPERAWSSPS